MKSELNNIQVLKKEDLLSFFLNNLAFHLKPDVYENVVIYVDKLVKITLENVFLYHIPKNELRGNQEVFIYKIDYESYLLFDRDEFNVWIKAKSINNGNDHDMGENTQLYLNVIKENVFKNTNATVQLDSSVKNVLSEIKRNSEDVIALKVFTETNNENMLESVREISSKMNTMVAKVDANDNNILKLLSYSNNLVDVLCKKIDVSLDVCAQIQRQLNTMYGNNAKMLGTDGLVKDIPQDPTQPKKRKSFWSKLFK